MRKFFHKAENATSRFRGVSWDRGKDRFRAEIEVAGRRYKLGWHSSEETAAIAYDRAAVRLGVPERCNSPQIYAEAMREKFGENGKPVPCAYCRGVGQVGGEFQTVYRGRATIAALGEWRDCPKCAGAGYTQKVLNEPKF